MGAMTDTWTEREKETVIVTETGKEKENVSERGNEKGTEIEIGTEKDMSMVSKKPGNVSQSKKEDHH